MEKFFSSFSGRSLSSEHRLAFLLSGRPSAEPRGPEGMPDGPGKGPEKTPVKGPDDAKKEAEKRTDKADATTADQVRRLYDAKDSAAATENLAKVGGKILGGVQYVLDKVSTAAHDKGTKVEAGSKDRKNLDGARDLARAGADWFGSKAKAVDSYGAKKGAEKDAHQKKIDDVKKVIEEKEGKKPEAPKAEPKTEPKKPEVAPMPKPVDKKPDAPKVETKPEAPKAEPKTEPKKPEVAPMPKPVDKTPEPPKTPPAAPEAKKPDSPKVETKPEAKTDTKPDGKKPETKTDTTPDGKKPDAKTDATPGDKKPEAGKDKPADAEPGTVGEKIAKDINTNLKVLTDPKASPEDKFAAGIAVLGAMVEYFNALRSGTLKSLNGGSNSLTISSGEKKGPDGKPTSETGADKKPEAKGEKKEEKKETRDRLKKELKPGEDLAGLRDRKVAEKATAETQLGKDKADLRKSEEELAKAEDGLKKEADASKKPAMQTAIDSMKARITSQKAAVEKQEATVKALDADIKDLDGLKADGEKLRDQMKDKVKELVQLLTGPDGKPLDGAKTVMEALEGMSKDAGGMAIDKNFEPTLSLDTKGMVALRTAAEKNGMDGTNEKMGVDSSGKVTNTETFVKFLGDMYTKVKPKVTR